MIVAMMFPLRCRWSATSPRAVLQSHASARLRCSSPASRSSGSPPRASSVALVARAGCRRIHLAPWAGLICCALAALWQVSAAKVRAVNRCHGTVALRPWPRRRPRRDRLRPAARHALRARLPAGDGIAAVGGLGLAAMAAISAIVLAERARNRPQYRLSAVAILLLLGLMTMAV